MTTHYTATIQHHSIARAREVAIEGTLAAAKRAATREFGGELLDAFIVVADERGEIVAKRRVGDSRWE